MAQQKRTYLERSLIVERAMANGLSCHDVELAITYQIMGNVLTEKDGILRFRDNSGARELPSQQLRSYGNRAPAKKPERARAYPIVKDVIERRTDGRPKHIESLDAFAEELDRLGYSPFRLWWKQTVAEFGAQTRTLLLFQFWYSRRHSSKAP